MVIAGCVGAQPGSDEENPVSGQNENRPAVTDNPATPALEEFALRITSEHLSVPVGELEIVSLEPIDWRDSSLGCPQPGRDYMQVITPGHLALVRQASAIYRVHMADGRGFICENDPKKLAASTPRPMLTLSQNQLEALARTDLAHRLGVRSDEISIIGTESVVWPDATLGCGTDDELLKELSGSGPSKGFVIMLAHRSREYEYHADPRRVIPCPPIEAR
jgi:hypothetical protein